jgi:glycosyltransferase involved in cell wall biosynthesis
MAGAILGRVFRCPVVITLRGSIVRLARYPLHRPQLRFALRTAARVLSVSEALKHVAVDLGIAPERIRVIPNGVDTGRFRPLDKRDAQVALGLPVGRTTLLSVGALTEGKGHHRVVGVLPTLLRDHPDLLYVIVGGARAGDGFRRMLERRIDNAGVRHHVLITGARPHEEIPQWLAAADLFCLATRSEGWANVLLEALACGRPVVTTSVGGNPEIVTSDALGLLVPPTDDASLARAIHEALRRRWDPEPMVAHARAHSWETAADRVAAELRCLVPPGGPHVGVASATDFPPAAGDGVLARQGPVGGAT